VVRDGSTPGDDGHAEAVQAHVREFPRVRIGWDAPVVLLSDRGVPRSDGDRPPYDESLFPSMRDLPL
jgi:hypothetical protein